MTEVSEATEVATYLDIDEFIAVHFGRLLGLAMLKSGNRQEAEDLVQDALIKLVDSWETVAQMDNPWGWLATVTVNLSVSRWRRSVRARAPTPTKSDSACNPAPLPRRSWRLAAGVTQPR